MKTTMCLAIIYALTGCKMPTQTSDQKSLRGAKSVVKSLDDIAVAVDGALARGDYDEIRTLFKGKSATQAITAFKENITKGIKEVDSVIDDLDTIKQAAASEKAVVAIQSAIDNELLELVKEYQKHVVAVEKIVANDDSISVFKIGKFMPTEIRRWQEALGTPQMVGIRHPHLKTLATHSANLNKIQDGQTIRLFAKQEQNFDDMWSAWRFSTPSAKMSAGRSLAKPKITMGTPEHRLFVSGFVNSQVEKSMTTVEKAVAEINSAVKQGKNPFSEEGLAKFKNMCSTFHFDVVDRKQMLVLIRPDPATATRTHRDLLGKGRILKGDDEGAWRMSWARKLEKELIIPPNSSHEVQLLSNKYLGVLLADETVQ